VQRLDRAVDVEVAAFFESEQVDQVKCTLLPWIGTKLPHAPVREKGADLRTSTAGYVRLDPLRYAVTIECAAGLRRFVVGCRVAGRPKRRVKTLPDLREIVASRLLDAVAGAVEEARIVTRLVAIDINQG
jgi:hypothetical protein